VSAETTRPLHASPTWLIVIVVALAFITIEVAMIGWQRNAAVAPSARAAVPVQAPASIAPAMSGDLVPVVAA